MSLIKHKKNLNPILGIAIGFILILFGMFGILFLFGDKLSEGLYFLIILPFVFVGCGFLVMNGTFLGLKRLAKQIDESLAVLNPETFIGSTSIVTKVKNLFIIKFNDHYLRIIKLHHTDDYSPSWFRRVFSGPKLPTNFPLKSPVVTEFHGFPLRKCEGTAAIYDPEEDRWITGHASNFSIFFFSQPMSTLLYPEVFLNFLEFIEHAE